MGDVIAKMNKILNYNTNNLWLGNNSNEVVIDPTTGPEDPTLTLTMRTMSVTFESIHKNLASYPNVIDVSQDNIIIKTFYLENNKKIIDTTEISTDGNVITTTITGDTGLDYPIRRTKTLYDNIKTIYSEVK